jgi:glycosyltransferase involved in cell wall biosynthesis
VADAADGLVVASIHERSRLRRAGITAPVLVIPLPIVPLAAPTTRRRVSRRRTVAILGFVYPGKGHAEVIAAVGSLPPDVQVVALGRASDGHQPLVDCLRRTATSMDRRLLVTGFLDDATLADALHRVDVPVVAARSVSASASVATWIAAGRRPLVARNAYATELAAHDADLVTLYDPEDLTLAIERALDDPSTTRRRKSIPQALQLSVVAEAHCELYGRTAR